MSKHHPPASPTTITPEDYSHSPVHYAVAVADHSSLSRLVSNLPRLADPSQIHTESDSLTQERLSDEISAVLDRRDNPHRETPLHLAVRINDAFATRTLAVAGADISLQNAAGWNALQEAVCRRCSEIIVILVQHHHIAAWSKWRRRLPRLLAGLRRMRDFYMEISFHFESSIVPFVGKIAPSDTYKIWKRDGNLRADTSLAGYDGLKIQRANQSFLFLGDGDDDLNIPSGSLLVLNHDDRRIFDAFENAGAPLSDSEIAGFCAQTSVYRPGMDVTKAELVARTNWRRQEKVESVGEWKARVYEVNNVHFSFRSRKIAGGDGDFAGSEQILPLELEDDADEGFLVAENPRFSVSDNQRRHSSFVGSEREFVTVSRKSVDIIPERRRPQPSLPPLKERDFVSVSRKSVDIIPERRRPPQPCLAPVGERDFVTVSRKSVDIIPQRQRPPQPYLAPVGERESVSVSRKSVVDIMPTRRRPPPYATPVTVVPPQTKEKEYSKNLKPSVWLTDNFPLKTEELLPLLDILANKVKAVRRMRELLTTKFPPGTFPVKVSIPVVPTVRVVITFTKFVELQPLEQFYTPLSSPQDFNQGKGGCEEDERDNITKSSSSSSSTMPSLWLSRSSSRSSSSSTNKQLQHQGANEPEPFAIPDGYSWSSFDDKNRRMRKSKSSSKNK